MVAMGNGEKYMSKKNSAVLAGAFIVGIVILFGIFFAGYRMVQTRQHFARVQSELQSTKQVAYQANAQFNEVQTKLKQSTSEI
jgi:heme/copper-type cytochrome/quinol oxidase subunit 3